MNRFQQLSRSANRLVAPLLRAPVVGGLLGRSMAEIFYTGRRTGTEHSLVVAYRKVADDELFVGVALPDKKSWWRNFLGEPHPVTVRIDGRDLDGTAIAKQTPKGVSVRILLQPNGTE